MFDFAAIAWPERLALAWGAFVARADGERLVGAIVAERHGKAVMLQNNTWSLLFVLTHTSDATARSSTLTLPESAKNTWSSPVQSVSRSASRIAPSWVRPPNITCAMRSSCSRTASSISGLRYP